MEKWGPTPFSSGPDILWRIWPLLGNGPLTNVSVTSRNNPLLGNSSVSMFPWQRIKQSNWGTVWDGDLYSGRLEVSSVRRVQSSGIRESSVGIHKGVQ
jgi:hypothetical protein